MTAKANQGVVKAIAVAGGQNALAAALGVSQPTISYYLYQRCPAEKAIEIEIITRVPREEIRPDLFKGSATDGESSD
jgi:DNA-binding transcriptional regulator YdaS (Cro superfamily)